VYWCLRFSAIIFGLGDPPLLNQSLPKVYMSKQKEPDKGKDDTAPSSINIPGSLDDLKPIIPMHSSLKGDPMKVWETLAQQNKFTWMRIILAAQLKEPAWLSREDGKVNQFFIKNYPVFKSFVDAAGSNTQTYLMMQEPINRIEGPHNVELTVERGRLSQYLNESLGTKLKVETYELSPDTLVQHREEIKRQYAAMLEQKKRKTEAETIKAKRDNASIPDIVPVPSTAPVAAPGQAKSLKDYSVLGDNSERVLANLLKVHGASNTAVLKFMEYEAATRSVYSVSEAEDAGWKDAYQKTISGWSLVEMTDGTDTAFITSAVKDDPTGKRKQFADVYLAVRDRVLG
jgi:hypothetical protein